MLEVLLELYKLCVNIEYSNIYLAYIKIPL